MRVRPTVSVPDCLNPITLTQDYRVQNGLQRIESRQNHFTLTGFTALNELPAAAGAAARDAL